MRNSRRRANFARITALVVLVVSLFAVLPAGAAPTTLYNAKITTFFANSTTKVYAKPLTPYRRLLSSSVLSCEKRQVLKETFAQIDPYDLRLKIDQLTRKLQEFAVPYK